MKDIQRLKELYIQYKDKKCSDAEVELFFDLLSQSCFSDFNQNSTCNVGAQLQVTTVAGECKEFFLSDGTVVKLGEKSTLIYSELFKGHQRFVSLEGQAVFNVAPSAEYPFVISSGKVTTKINEGCLNILAFEHLKGIEVSVLKGKAIVSIETPALTRKWSAKPGKSVVVNPHLN